MKIEKGKSIFPQLGDYLLSSVYPFLVSIFAILIAFSFFSNTVGSISLFFWLLIIISLIYPFIQLFICDTFTIYQNGIYFKKNYFHGTKEEFVPFKDIEKIDIQKKFIVSMIHVSLKEKKQEKILLYPLGSSDILLSNLIDHLPKTIVSPSTSLNLNKGKFVTNIYLPIDFGIFWFFFFSGTTTILISLIPFLQFHFPLYSMYFEDLYTLNSFFALISLFYYSIFNAKVVDLYENGANIKMIWDAPSGEFLSFEDIEKIQLIKSIYSIKIHIYSRYQDRNPICLTWHPLDQKYFFRKISRKLEPYISSHNIKTNFNEFLEK